MKTPYERWSSKVQVSDNCWDWVGAKTRGGYGHFRMLVNGSWVMYKAHRFSYEYHNQVDLDKETLVCHRCDNPACVNPAHLFIGSAKDNMQDCIKKGRQKWGHQKGHRLLTEDIVNKIRLLYNEGGYSMKDVGDMFNTSATQVCRVVNNKTWKAGTED